MNTQTPHRRAKDIALLLLNLGLLLAASPWAFAQVNAPPAVDAREDRILVKPKAGVNLAALHTALGVQVLHTYPEIGNLQVLQLPAPTTVAGAIGIYQASGLVEYAEPDLIVHALAAPDDTHFRDNSLWGLNNIGLFGGLPEADID